MTVSEAGVSEHTLIIALCPRGQKPNQSKRAAIFSIRFRNGKDIHVLCSGVQNISTFARHTDFLFSCNYNVSTKPLALICEILYQVCRKEHDCALRQLTFLISHLIRSNNIWKSISIYIYIYIFFFFLQPRMKFCNSSTPGKRTNYHSIQIQIL